jgi:phenylacetate-CoA ligase
MNFYLEDIYRHSPIFIQNMLCSIYGFKLYRERYGSPWKEYYKHLMNTQYSTEEEIKRIQLYSFKKILLHAIEYVPHYQNVLKNMKSDIEILNSFAVIKELPILEKSLLREIPQLFISNYYNKHNLMQINTSGTTGSPLTIYVTPKARKMNYAFFARSKYWAGITGFEKSITLAGRTIVPVSQKKPPYWRKNIIFSNTLFSSYHISEDSLKHYLKKIQEIQPVFIDSYPSSIATIAKYVIDNSICDMKVKAIITSAETLLDHQREIIERAFGCKVYDQYGSAEQVVFACQCEKGSYHINPEYGYIEILDNNNNPVKNGEMGEIVCTGFTNDAMPFIRYKIGDMGILSNKKCECGRNFPILEKIYGRRDDILITPEGRYIGRLDPIFKGLRTIQECQIIQDSNYDLTLNIVKGSYFKESEIDILKYELRKRVGSDLNISIIYKDFIPRTSSGKFRAVISKVK